MRTKLQEHPSTPTVSDAPHSSNDTLTVSFDGHPTVQAILQILKPLASGGQGEVLDARLLFLEAGVSNAQQKREYPCVAKHLFTLSDPHTPTEFKMQEALTHGHPSAESGLLRIMGIHTVTDEDGRMHKYAIMPKCDAILSNCLPTIRALDGNEETKPIFFHVIMDIFRSVTHGAQNLSIHEVAHRDHKLENMGLHNGTWCILDFGLARHYTDCVNKKMAKKESMFVGTPHYIPPETINEESNYPFEGDIWSFGQIFRKLRGESYSHQYDENGFELATLVHLYEKVSAYKAERIQEEKRRMSSTSAFDAVNYQLELQKTMSEKSNFKECFDTIVNAMCSILPEHRPNLATMQKACTHLQSLLPMLSSDHQLNEFYCKITAKAETRETAATSPNKLGQTAPFYSPQLFAEKRHESTSSTTSTDQSQTSFSFLSSLPAN